VGPVPGRVKLAWARAVLAEEALAAASAAKAVRPAATQAAPVKAFNDDGRAATFTLPVTGPAGHTRTLTLTAPQIATLRSGGEISIQTGDPFIPGGGAGSVPHRHNDTIKCS
jgi:hypothetical protein